MKRNAETQQKIAKRFKWHEEHKIHGRPVNNGRCIICDTTTGYFKWNSEKLGYECTECLGEINQSLREFGDDDLPGTTIDFHGYYDEELNRKDRERVSLAYNRKTQFDV